MCGEMLAMKQMWRFAASPRQMTATVLFQRRIGFTEIISAAQSADMVPWRRLTLSRRLPLVTAAVTRPCAFDSMMRSSMCGWRNGSPPTKVMRLAPAWRSIDGICSGRDEI